MDVKNLDLKLFSLETMASQCISIAQIFRIFFLEDFDQSKSFQVFLHCLEFFWGGRIKNLTSIPHCLKLEKYLETEIKKGRKIKKKLRMQPQINKTLTNNEKYLKTNWTTVMAQFTFFSLVNHRIKKILFDSLFKFR